MNPMLSAAYSLTASDYYALPEGPPYFQLIDGELYMAPSPNRYHQDIVQNIAVLLIQHVRTAALGRVYVAPSDVIFADNQILHPDIYFVSTGRSQILTAQGAKGAPDLVIEVLSPGTATLDLGRKREIYAESGVVEYWAVAPLTKTIAIFRFGECPDQPVATLRENEMLSSPLLPGFSSPVSQIFQTA